MECNASHTSGKDGATTREVKVYPGVPPDLMDIRAKEEGCAPMNKEIRVSAFENSLCIPQPSYNQTLLRTDVSKHYFIPHISNNSKNLNRLRERRHDFPIVLNHMLEIGMREPTRKLMGLASIG
ncbi:hypothetical protein V6N13_142237 [Hibiscus sabdariffa]